MFTFTSERLVPKPSEHFQIADQSTISKISEPLISCRRRISEAIDSERRQAHIRELSSLLLVTLKEAQVFDARAQCQVINLVANDILQNLATKDNDPEEKAINETLLQECDWDVLYLLEPYLITANGEDHEASSARRAATALFRHVGSFLRPKELFLIVSEKMSMVDWQEFVKDEAYAINLSIITTNYLQLLQNYGIEKISDPKQLALNILYPVKFCARILAHLGHMAADIPSFDKDNSANVRQGIILVLASSILGIIQACRRYKPSWPKFLERCQTKTLTFHGLQDDRELWLWYLSSYLLLLIFEKVLLAMDLNMSEIYCQHFQQKYPVSMQRNGSSQSKDTNIANTKVYFARQCMTLAVEQGLTFDNALIVRRWWDSNVVFLSKDDDDNDEEQRNAVKRFPFSYEGIAALLSFSIYFSLVPTENHLQSLNTMPVIIEPRWLGREYLGVALNLMKQSERSCPIDKALVVLLYLSDNVEYTLTAKILQDTQLQGPMDDKPLLTIIDALRVMYSVAASCTVPSIRFVVYQLISRFIEHCNEEARVFVFLDLFHNCTYPAMLAAAVSLFKQQIDAAFKSTIPSCFNSRVVSDKFFPKIFQEPERDTFWQMYGYHMQVVNLYLYLLIKDRPENKTRVWEPDLRAWVDRTYLAPLLKICSELLQRPASDSNEAQTERMQIEILESNIERIREQER